MNHLFVRSLARALARLHTSEQWYIGWYVRGWVTQSGGVRGGGWGDRSLNCPLARSHARSLAALRWYMGWRGEDESLNCLLARSRARSLAHSIQSSGIWDGGWRMDQSNGCSLARTLARSLTRSLAAVRWYTGWWGEDESLNCLLAPPTACMAVYLRVFHPSTPQANYDSRPEPWASTTELRSHSGSEPAQFTSLTCSSCPVNISYPERVAAFQGPSV